MNNFFRLTIAAACLLLLSSLSLAHVGAERFSNLKVLPKNTTKEQMKKVMRAQSEALGVDCDYCHDEANMAADDNEHKKAARQMMKMTKEINSKWFGKDGFVTCGSCHRGKTEPPDFVPPKKDDAKAEEGK